ncbi:hypothetical protein K439DRAFT_1626847 [Ramaria rubella]|nr:hypothetical protein K439DRAFT_1626847 [Ramaria rubella]
MYSATIMSYCHPSRVTPAHISLNSFIIFHPLMVIEISLTSTNKRPMQNYHLLSTPSI